MQVAGVSRDMGEAPWYSRPNSALEVLRSRHTWVNFKTLRHWVTSSVAPRAAAPHSRISGAEMLWFAVVFKDDTAPHGYDVKVRDDVDSLIDLFINGG